jgi:guanylate kinase
LEAIGEEIKKGHLFVVSGPSGVGKTTLIERFLRDDSSSRFSVSYTTRQRRANEVNGRDYFFVDTETFEQMIEEGHFLEWERVHGQLYGTPQKEVLDALQEGIDLFLDIDVNGALRVKKRFENACLIFVEPLSQADLMKRLALRGEREVSLRMTRVSQEMERKYLFQYCIINDKLEEAYRDLIKIIEDVRRKDNGKDYC